MKTILRILTFFCLLLSAGASQSQCPAGYSQASINWDLLDYFVYTGSYSSAGGYLNSNNEARNQHFAFGTQRLSIVHNFADAASLGENTSHTGEAGSYGAGADINFSGNGTISFTFENEVRNFRISVYDLDNSQSLNVTATNAASTAQIITMTRANLASAIVVAGSGTTSATATTALVGSVGTTSNSATVNIDVAGPVRTITLTFGGTAGDFWISDVQACSVGSFPSNYYNVSRPFTGQPGYVLHAFDDKVYMVDPATGVTKFLFQDVAGLGNINSMGYDPYNKILYYVYSLTGPGNARRLMKYDFNTETISIVLNDIETIGISTVNTNGAESGAGAFYNGSFYIGIETSNSSRNSGREAVIWRIDFNASNVPYRASQVFAVPIDGNLGGRNVLLHDWSDFTIHNGVLYNFDAAENDNGAVAAMYRNQSDVYHVDLQSGALMIQYVTPGASASPSWYPGQPCVGWDGTVYSIFSNGAAPSTPQGMPFALPYVAPYNAGALGTRNNLTSTPMFTPATPSLGDAAEAFKPKADFGDAPASYDPDPLAPAVHEYEPLLRLGTGFDREWTFRGQSSAANADNFDDGLPFVPTFNPNYDMYLTEVSVFNNTGADATVCGWLDADGDGLFEAAEAVSITVSSSPAQQTVYLYWPNIPSNLPMGSITHLRIRITSAANGMTTANPTGYFNNGEVEDYRVIVNNYALSTQVTNFDAQKTSDRRVSLQWNAVNEETGSNYELEKSADGQSWKKIHQRPVMANNAPAAYSYIDAAPYKGISYYRLKTIQKNGAFQYSAVRRIDLSSGLSLSLAPNPASELVKLTVNSEIKTTAELRVVDLTGRLVHQQSLSLEQGTTVVPLHFTAGLPNGMYAVRLQIGGKVYHDKLIIKN